jgi:hypothetical protein
MKRFAIAAILALVLGSQADAQLIRRFGTVYSYPNATYSYSPYYYDSTGAVISAGYYSTPSYYPSTSYYYPSTSWYYPSSWSYPSYGYGYTNYYSYPRYGWRRGWRW